MATSGKQRVEELISQVRSPRSLPGSAVLSYERRRRRPRRRDRRDGDDQGDVEAPVHTGSPCWSEPSSFLSAMRTVQHGSQAQVVWCPCAGKLLDLQEGLLLACAVTLVAAKRADQAHQDGWTSGAARQEVGVSAC